MAHGAVEEPYFAAMSLQFLKQQDLMDVVTGQPVRCREQNQIKVAGGNAVAQPVKTGTPQ
jgi:hypothetical protein